LTSAAPQLAGHARQDAHDVTARTLLEQDLLDLARALVRVVEARALRCLDERVEHAAILARRVLRRQHVQERPRENDDGGCDQQRQAGPYERLPQRAAVRSGEAA
jgi:hypothetical protein